MTSRFTRRQFTVGTSAALVSLTIPAGRTLAAPELTTADAKLIELGANALSRAHSMNYFADGHRGAAMISAHLMCIDNDLDAATRTRISELFDGAWAQTKLCEPFPDEDPVEDAPQRIGKALADGSGVLRQVGHDAIFAMHAIKAFRSIPALATPQRVDGVCKLIRAFKPWRDIEPTDDVQPPPFEDQQACARFVLQEAYDALDRWQGFGQGFTGHMLTFGQSLIEMAAMGDAEWAESCRIAFRKYVTVTRGGPGPDDRPIKDHNPSDLRPDQIEYWRRKNERGLALGHVFKYPYAYYDLLNRANDPELANKFDSRAYLLF